MLLVQAEGLEPSPKGQSYTVWLANRRQKLPLRDRRSTKVGLIAGSFQIAADRCSACSPSGFDRIDVSLVSDEQLGAALKANARRRKGPPTYAGTTVLRGRSPARSSKPANRQGQA